jgi:flagellin
MAMYVNTNVSGLGAQRNLQMVTDRMNSSFEKLSSGSRINSARDDSAGLQIADRLTTQITGLNQANRNANDGISIAQIAEGALSEVTNNVQRMRQLVVQGGNRTLAQDDRDALGEEFQKLISVNESIADRTAYGSIQLLNYDSNASGFQVQTGAQSGQQDSVTTGNAKLTSLFGQILEADSITGTLSTLSAAALSDAGVLGEITAAYMFATNQTAQEAAIDALFGGTDLANASGNLSELGTNSFVQLAGSELVKVLTFETSGNIVTNDQSDLVAAIGSDFVGFAATDVNSLTGFDDSQLNAVHNFATDTLLDVMSDMVTQVDRNRAKLGAEQNGLSSTIRSNSASIVNVSDARARIQDTDFATETAELTRNQIIQQAATSILSQANQLPNAALSLLR